MKTLQDLIDAELAKLRAEERAAADWRNHQPLREADAADALADYLRKEFDVVIGDDAVISAFERPCAVGAPNRRYEVKLIFPAINADISIAMHVDARGTFHRSDNAFDVQRNGTANRFLSLAEALMWITNNSRAALAGQPVLVTLPQPQEA